MNFHQPFTYEIARAEHEARIRHAELYRHLHRDPRPRRRHLAPRLVGPTLAVLATLSLVLR